MINKIIFIIIICLSVMGFQDCKRGNDEMMPIGTDKDGKSHLVYFFKKGASSEQIQQFLNYELSTPEPDGTGYKSLPGYESSALIIVNGYRGYEMQFKPNATEEQKNLIKKRVIESPIVYKVFENVDSSKIVLDPVEAKKEKDRLERNKQDKRPNKSEGSKKSDITNNNSNQK